MLGIFLESEGVMNDRMGVGQSRAEVLTLTLLYVARVIRRYDISSDRIALHRIAMSKEKKHTLNSPEAVPRRRVVDRSGWDGMEWDWMG